MEQSARKQTADRCSHGGDAVVPGMQRRETGGWGKRSGSCDRNDRTDGGDSTDGSRGDGRNGNHADRGNRNHTDNGIRDRGCRKYGTGRCGESDEDGEADEWAALYKEYQDQALIYFTLALCEAGYDKICLVNGNYESTTYFSVKDGNYYTFFEGEEQIILYVPYIPTEFSCDNENIDMHYWYKEQENTDDDLINNIQLYCEYFKGDDVPVNISVTFEDGSTQEITVYLTRHTG